MLISELDTPVLIADLDIMEKNIRDIQDYCDRHNLNFRPHIKTHKTPAIAHKQLEAGAIGITCQKVGEAEVMCDAGIKDILIPYNIIGAEKLERLARLSKRAHITVAVDSEFCVSGIAGAMQEYGSSVDIIIEMDTGGGRCGVQNPEEALDLARKIVRMPNVVFKGLMTFPTRRESGPVFRKTIDLLENDGIHVEMVSGGGTGSERYSHEIPELTEIRLGTYVFCDMSLVASGIRTLDQCVLRVLVTVISTPVPGRAIIDGGIKTFTSDFPSLGTSGYIVEYPEAKFHAHSEEHGNVDTSALPHNLKVGERLTVIPNHACGIMNLHDQLVGMRKGVVEAIWNIAARGKVK